MFALALANVRHNLGRYIATLVAIVTGVGFFAATGFISARVADGLNGAVDDQYGAVDVAVVPKGLAGNDVISAAQAEALEAVPGVAGGEGVLEGKVSFKNAQGGIFAKEARAALWTPDDDLNPLTIEEGDAPQRRGEIALDRGTADRYDLAVGDEETLLTPAGPQDVVITGITAFADTDALNDSGDVSLTEADAVDWLAGGEEAFTSYFLRASDSSDDLLREVRGVLPPGFRAQAGDDFRDEQKELSGTFGTFIERGLQAFAVLALLVGGFVIYNTFSVIVAQRLRELAVLAAIGATGKQLKASLRREGIAIGLIGSVLGVVAGGVITMGGIAIAEALGRDVPGGGLIIPWGSVFLSIVLGTVITTLSVSIPARRAAATDPMDALLTSARDPGGASAVRLAFSVTAVALGIALMAVGGSGLDVGAGALLVAAGAVAAGPFLAGLAARLARPLMQRAAGLEGRLAADNTQRNAQRTATTANALFIGVFLVTLVAISGTSVKEFAVGEINKVQSADYTLESGPQGIDDAMLSDLQNVEGVTEIAPVQQSSATFDGVDGTLSGAEIARLQEIASIETSRGDLADLDEGTIAMVDLGLPNAPKIGDKITVQGEAGSGDLELVALVSGSLDSLALEYLVDERTFTEFEGEAAPVLAYIDTARDAGDLTADLERITNERPDLTLTPGNFLGQAVSSIFDFAIQAVIALLMMSVLIALIGIVNTMSLAILERRRELGLLRIIGMTDRTVRRMVRLESILIALIGTLTGVVTGVGVSLGLLFAMNRLSSAEVTPQVPALLVGGILVLGVLLGYAAALIPARRATRLDVLDAVQVT